MNKIKTFAKEFIKNEDGANMLEYVMLAFGLMLAVIVIVRALGGTLGNRFSRLNDEMSKNN